MAALAATVVAWIGVAVWSLDPSVEAAQSISVRWPITAVASSAAVTIIIGLAVGHMAMARLRWPGHFARLPRLMLDVWRDAGGRGRPAGAGGLIGIVTALYLQPAVAVGLAAAAVGLTVTDVGRALIAGWHESAAAWRRAAHSRPGPSVATRRLIVLAFGLAAGIVGLIRFFLLDAPCLADRLLGAPCGASTLAVAGAVTVGALASLPLSMGLGALVSLVLDGKSLAEIGGVAPVASADVATGTPPEPATEATTERATEPATEPQAGVAEAQEAVPDHATVGEVSGPGPVPVDTEAVAQDEETVPEEPLVGTEPDDQDALAAAAALAHVAAEADETDETDEVAPVPPDQSEHDPIDEVEDAAVPPEENQPAAIDEIEDAPTDERQHDPTDEMAPIETDPSDTDTIEEIPSAPPSGSPGTETDHLSAAARAHLGDLSPDAQANVAPVLEILDELPPEQVRELVDEVATYEGTVATLRTQYRRAPGIAKGAIERACVAGLRGAGLSADTARQLATTLLQLDEDDWKALRNALASLDESLPPSNASP